ncbi:MAG: MarR family winged helix-turn-helix transcriptional regulator [Deltaproteobacteria bacterium]
MEFADFICFRLGAVSRKMARHYNNKLGTYGITIVQSWVLFHLAGREGSSIKDIAAAIQLDSPVVTGVVDRLVKEGLVIRQEVPNDRRSVKISITAHGGEIVEEISPAVEEYNRRIRSIVQEGDLSAFERALAALEAEL